MIVVTGSVTAREDSLGEITRLSLEHVHRSRREPGCISHAVRMHSWFAASISYCNAT
jgi:quinol monooxygenase YgiN